MESFSCLWVANTLATFFNGPANLSDESPDRVRHSTIWGSFKHNVGTVGVDKSTSRKPIQFSSVGVCLLILIIIIFFLFVSDIIVPWPHRAELYH